MSCSPSSQTFRFQNGFSGNGFSWLSLNTDLKSKPCYIRLDLNLILTEFETVQWNKTKTIHFEKTFSSESCKCIKWNVDNPVNQNRQLKVIRWHNVFTDMICFYYCEMNFSFHLLLLYSYLTEIKYNKKHFIYILFLKFQFSYFISSGVIVNQTKFKVKLKYNEI